MLSPELKATLERAVGVKLVERPGGPRRVSLTEAGEVLLGHAQSIMARLNAAQADLADLSDGAAGRLRVGTYQSVGTRILPLVMRDYPVFSRGLRYRPVDRFLRICWTSCDKQRRRYRPTGNGNLRNCRLRRNAYRQSIGCGAS